MARPHVPDGVPDVPQPPPVPLAPGGAGGAGGASGDGVGRGVPRGRSPYSAAAPANVAATSEPATPTLAAPYAWPGAPADNQPSPYTQPSPYPGPAAPGPGPQPHATPSGATPSPTTPSLTPNTLGTGSVAMPTIEKPPLDAVSTAAVVTGAVGLGPVAVVLGAIGLRRTTTSWRRSPAIAAVGLGLGILGTLGWTGVAVAAGLGAFSGPSTQAIPGDAATPRTVHASALAVGNCIETLPPQQEVGELRVVPCASPHVGQVVLTPALDAATYPGPDAALEAGEQACAAEFDARAFDETTVLRWWIVPTPEAWDEGVRTVVCVARSLVGPVSEDYVN